MGPENGGPLKCGAPGATPNSPQSVPSETHEGERVGTADLFSPLSLKGTWNGDIYSLRCEGPEGADGSTDPQEF